MHNFVLYLALSRHTQKRQSHATHSTHNKSAKRTNEAASRAQMTARKPKVLLQDQNVQKAESTEKKSSTRISRIVVVLPQGDDIGNCPAFYILHLDGPSWTYSRMPACLSEHPNLNLEVSGLLQSCLLMSVVECSHEDNAIHFMHFEGIPPIC